MLLIQRRSAILSEKTPDLSRRRWRRWLLIGAGLPLLGVMAAFGIAPDTRTEAVPLLQVIQELPLTISPPPETAFSESYWREERIQRGDTIASLLARLDIDDPEAVKYLRTAHRVRSLYQLVPGRTIRAVTNGAGSLVSLRYLHGDGTALIVRRDGNGFATTEQPVVTQTQLVMASGEIRTSLFAATDSAGLSDMVALQLAEIFSSEIDFHRDLRPGDRFSVVYEALYNEGEVVRTGRIVAAEFTNDRETYRALYFRDNQGRGGYYTPDGKNVRKAFLRSPLEFSRITSGFTQARLHPVLNIWRAHKGVDYGAPVGTRVRVTADGQVQFVGRQGGYGNLVVVRHNNGYATAYGHLAGFAKGLRPGQRVSQGEIIGFVGKTGLATGPHLHYEFRVGGVHQNPLRFATPPGQPIARDARAAFDETSHPLLERLDLIQHMNLATAN
jgi:murein DD-endopeptidase MepM/ murein hydrolase activator NlpD